MQTEGAQSLSPFNSMVREAMERVKLICDEQPARTDAYTWIPILRNERRSRAGRECRRDFVFVLSILALKKRYIFASDNDVVPHRINPDHDE